MCIIAWNWQPYAEIPLVLISNRDEFYERPTLPLHWWCCGEILAGKDLFAGGTWLGTSRNGKLAALTNHRNLNLPTKTTTSRGELVAEFLSNSITTDEFIKILTTNSDDYSFFNLIFFDKNKLYGFESRNKKLIEIQPGFGVLSNGDFNSNWFKTNKIKINFYKLIKNNSININENLFEILKDHEQAPAHYLPDTGLSLEMEQELSSIFIKTSVYGTRSSSIIKFSNSSINFSENTFSFDGLIEKNSYFYNY